MVWILIEVLEVLIAGQLWDPWRLDSLLLYNVPVNALEPSVGFDVLGLVAEAAESPRDILFQKADDELTSGH